MTKAETASGLGCGSTDAPAVIADGVHKRYGARKALDGVSVRVERGEFFGLLGPNGAGKTTLVEILEGLRQSDSGTVTVLGTAAWPRNRALLPRIGVQTQSSAFFVRQTASEHLATVAALYGVTRIAVEQALATVGLADQSEIRVEDLSGGQRQRLAIASALVHDPELIFLDEPTAALDPQARRSLWDVLRSMKAAGKTIVYTTHHLDEAEALCDRVAILVAGRIAALGTPRALVEASEQPTRLIVPAQQVTVERAQAIPGVDRAVIEGEALVLETRSSGQVLSALNTLAGLEGVQTRGATLEDVYLHLTSDARIEHTEGSPA
ncbi:ABC transporter ATP-binding protein [Streptomyces rubiginosohelvolus]|uniref:ABC transporter ATP-binding protein n=1 Tax=Streptomyces rubiginosohelvolus TaxID=67362 RepID=UPI00371B1333